MDENTTCWEDKDHDIDDCEFEFDTLIPETDCAVMYRQMIYGEMEDGHDDWLIG